jgi:hypothetical protein
VFGSLLYVTAGAGWVMSQRRSPRKDVDALLGFIARTTSLRLPHDATDKVGREGRKEGAPRHHLSHHQPPPHGSKVARPVRNVEEDGARPSRGGGGPVPRKPRLDRPTAVPPRGGSAHWDEAERLNVGCAGGEVGDTGGHGPSARGGREGEDGRGHVE